MDLFPREKIFNGLFFLFCATFGGYLLWTSFENNLSPEGQPRGSVLHPEGSVRLKTSKRGSWRASGHDEAIYAGTSIVTQSDSSARIRLKEAEVLIGSDTLVHIGSESASNLIDLRFGSVTVKGGTETNLTIAVRGKPLQLRLNGGEARIEPDYKSGKIQVVAVKGTVSFSEDGTTFLESTPAAAVALSFPIPEPEPVLDPVLPPPPAKETIIRRIQRKLAATPVSPPVSESTPLPTAVLESGSDDPEQVAVPRQLKQSLFMMVGGGLNWLQFEQRSPSASFQAGGLSWPSLLAQVDWGIGAWGVRASALRVATDLKMATVSGPPSTVTAIWHQDFLAAHYRTSPRFRLEAGAARDLLPLLRPSSSLVRLSTVEALGLAMGFSWDKPIGSRSLLIWEQRLVVPLSVQSPDINNIRLAQGIDGSLGLHHCLGGGWALGGAWFGQYREMKYDARSTFTSDSETNSGRVFHTNVQMQLSRGLCDD